MAGRAWAGKGRVALVRWQSWSPKRGVCSSVLVWCNSSDLGCGLPYTRARGRTILLDVVQLTCCVSTVCAERVDPTARLGRCHDHAALRLRQSRGLGTRLRRHEDVAYFRASNIRLPLMTLTTNAIDAQTDCEKHWGRIDIIGLHCRAYESSRSRSLCRDLVVTIPHPKRTPQPRVPP